MMEDKLNTTRTTTRAAASAIPTSACARRSSLGWKILIGHCPECCLDEMRRVRDEIEGGEKKKKKHHKDKRKKKHNGGRKR